MKFDAKRDIIITSYPRSGNSFLQFLILYMYSPEDSEHTFKSLHESIPTLNSDEMNSRRNDFDHPRFYKSHASFATNYPNVIYLTRHVGDVLISFYHYSKKFHGLSISFEDYLERMDYGKDWRASVNFWHHSVKVFEKFYGLKLLHIKFEDLLADTENVVNKITKFVSDITDTTPSNGVIQNAIRATKFESLQKIEQKGLDIQKDYDPNIRFFRSGKIGQWKKLSQDIQEKILCQNKYELNLLKY